MDVVFKEGVICYFLTNVRKLQKVAVRAAYFEEKWQL
jgi:hypothetical protein